MLSAREITPRFLKTVEYARVHDHVCMLYRTKEEQFASAVPFIKSGLQAQEQCLYVADDNSREDVIDALKAGDIDAHAHIDSGQLSILTKDDTYFAQDPFEPDKMIEALEKKTRVAAQTGYTAFRATGEMSWILGTNVDIEKMLIYEARLNFLYPNHRCLGMCQYNPDRFAPEVIRDVIYTHPTIIINGVFCENVFYKPQMEVFNDNPEGEVGRMITTLYEMAKGSV